MNIANIIERQQRAKEKLNLWERVKFECSGQSADDVATCAVTMLMSAMVLMSRDREHALYIADDTFAKMWAIIANDYEQLRDDVSKEPPRN